MGNKPELLRFFVVYCVVIVLAHPSKLTDMYRGEQGCEYLPHIKRGNQEMLSVINRLRNKDYQGNQ